MRCGLPHHKVRYPNQAAAELKAKKRMGEVIGLALRVYRCPICLGWHLTKRLLSKPGVKEITA